MSFNNFYNSLGVRGVRAGSQSPYGSAPFVAQIDVRNTSYNLALQNNSTTSNVTIDWGDGSAIQNIAPLSGGRISHTYSTTGIKTIIITGARWQFGLSSSPTPLVFGLSSYTGVDTDSSNRVINILQWGENIWAKLDYAMSLYGTSTGTNYSAIDVPNLSECTSLDFLCSPGNTGTLVYPSYFNSDISNWDISNINSMSYTFHGAVLFNQPIGNWNTSNVTGMTGTFMDAHSFNQPIGNWNTSNVTQMANMFRSFNLTAPMAFNQPIGNWNTSNVINMQTMFNGATAFNQNIGNWNTSNLISATFMFDAATSFNCGQPSGTAHSLMNRTASSGWRTNNVTSMFGMFRNASAFNGDISEWCVTNITSTPGLFDFNATAWTLPNSRPVWGTCPIP